MSITPASSANTMLLAPVTVVLGVMIESPTAERAQNLIAALTCLGRQTLNRSRYRIVLVEQGAEPHMEALVRPSIDEYVFAYSSGPFNRSWVLNVGVMRAPAGVICTFDGDLIVPRDFLQRGLMAWQCGAPAIKPFNEILYMDADSTQRVRQQLSQGERVDCNDPRYRGGLHPWSKGGCIWIDAALYRALGGHDERFEGWGDEDRDFWARLNRRTKVVTFQRRLLHLYHARDFQRHPEVAANRLLLRALKAGLLPAQRGAIGDVRRYEQEAHLQTRSGRHRHLMLANELSRRATERSDGSASVSTSDETSVSVLDRLEMPSNSLERLRCRDVSAAVRDPVCLWRRGSLALVTGELEVAIACLTRAATLNRRSVTYVSALGHALLHRRRFAEALSSHLRALTIAPHDSTVYRAVARALRAQGLWREAVTLYREALYLDPANAATFSALGDVLQRQQRLTDAQEACEIAIRLDPASADVHKQLGSVLASRGEWEAALSAFRRGLEAIDPASVESAAPLADSPLVSGIGVHSANESSLVVHGPDTSGLEAPRFDPDRLDANSPEELRAELQASIGDMLRHLGRTREAVVAYREALTSLPAHLHACRQLALTLEFTGETRDAATAWVALGVALQGRDRFQEARAAYHQALRHKPDCLRAAINLGRVYTSIGESEAAIRWFETALAIDPEHAAAHTDLGRACHLAGDTDRGWGEFAWFCHPQALKRRGFEQPIWDGSPLGSRTMLVWAEQALGDTIQWLRYLPRVKRLNPAARLIVECQRNLVPLARHLAGVDMVIGEGAPPPHFDLHVPLSLAPIVCRPLRFETPQVPYLSVDEALVDIWRHRLARLDHARASGAATATRQHLTVGLSWAGHPEGIAARQRFTSLAAFAPLADVKGLRFISLQMGRQAAQVLGPPPGLDVEVLQDDSHSTHDTAALIQSLDLIITVDTMIAHLAGALARPVWVVLPHVADWRWSRGTDRTDLYSTMRLFRQSEAGDWQGVFERVREELERVRGGGHPFAPDTLTPQEASTP